MKCKQTVGLEKLTKLTRINWVIGKVIAIKTYADLWVLAQFVSPTRIAFFDAFAEGANFTREQWESSQLIFINPATRQFLRGSSVFGTSLPGKKGINIPDAWINTEINQQRKKVILWEGTKNERRLNVTYGGSLVRDSSTILLPRIRMTDRKTIDNHELAGLAVCPYTNYRLYLCWLLSKNADPIKELAFRRPLPIEYKFIIDSLYPDDHF